MPVREPITLDAFARQRVSDPLTLFDAQMQYNKAPLFFEEYGTGSTAHAPLSSSVTLTVTGGQSITRQSRQYVRYKPGKSQFVLLTFLLGSPPSDDLVRRVGYFDDKNGIFLQQDSTGLAWVRRSYVSGATVDEVVYESNWGFRHPKPIDVTKTALAFIDMEWLGVGQVRCGFFLKGLPLLCHVFNATPSLETVYMQTASLPVRYEVVSDTNEGGSLSQICSAVISEGGFEEETGILQAKDNHGAGVSLTTAHAPVLAIRPSATFNGIVNRGQIVPESVEVYSDSNASYRVYWRGVTTAGTWSSHSGNSIVDYNVTGTGITTTSAELVASGWVAAGNKSGASVKGLASRLPITLDYQGANPIEMVVTMATLTGTGTGYAALSWREIY